MEDVITKLNQNGLSDIVEEIFCYLDYNSIKNSTEVSKSWRSVTDSDSVWKSLWERSMNQVPAWNLLYKRTVCQGTYYLQTHPEWSYKKACQIVGDAHQMLVSNWRKGIYKEQREEMCCSESLCCEISDTKVCRTVHNFDKLRIQERWCPEASPKEFDITGRPVKILHLKISEPHLVALTSDHSVCVWDLENNQKIQELFQEKTLDNLKLILLLVRLNYGLLITCARYGLSRSNNPPTSSGTVNLLMARQLVITEDKKRPDFPIAGQLKIPDFIIETMYLETQRIVAFNSDWSQALIVATKPFHIIRLVAIFPLVDRQRFWKEVELTTELKLVDKYWEGWLLQNESSDIIRIMNIDSGVAFKHPHNYIGCCPDFYIANNHVVISYQKDLFWKFDIWSLPKSGYSDKMNLVYTFQQPHPNVYHEAYYVRRNKLKIHFDDLQIWIFQFYDNWSLRDHNRILVIKRDFTF